MSLPTFGQLLSAYMRRSGISDSELARSIGVRRQTIFRWKEGLVERPRAREDVLQCAKKLRLSDDERDQLLLAAGFAPEQLVSESLGELLAGNNLTPANTTLPPAPDEATNAEPATESAPPPAAMLEAPPPMIKDEDDIRINPEPVAPPSRGNGASAAEVLIEEITATAIAATDKTESALSPQPSRWQARLLHIRMGRPLGWLPLGAGLIVLLLLWLLWTRRAPFLIPATPTPPAPATVVLHPPPQTTPTTLPVYPLAAEGESLLLVAQFTGYTANERYNVAGRISEALEQQITAAALVSTTVTIWPDEIPNAPRAGQLLAAANATMLIWGEYDSGRVRVNLETRNPQARQKRDFPLTSADELVTTINSTVPNEIRILALIALGRLLRDQGNYAAATAAFQQALALAPEDQRTRATLNFYLGYLAEQGGTLRDFNRAVAAYTRAVELDNRLFIAYYNRGTVQIKRYGLQPLDERLLVETLDAAIADLNTVIAHRPNYVDAYLNRGVAYYERDAPDDMAAALRDLSHVIALRADDAHAYYLRGLVQIRAGADTAWVADFQQTLALQPAHGGAISGLCWGYVLAQQAETALPYCDQALALDTTGASRDSRGMAYAQLGRYPEAIADFRTYLALLQTQEPATLYERYRGPLIEQWIVQLEAGENPFDAALLENLRHRDHNDRSGVSADS